MLKEIRYQQQLPRDRIIKYDPEAFAGSLSLLPFVPSSSPLPFSCCLIFIHGVRRPPQVRGHLQGLQLCLHMGAGILLLPNLLQSLALEIYYWNSHSDSLDPDLSERTTDGAAAGRCRGPCTCRLRAAVSPESGEKSRECLLLDL